MKKNKYFGGFFIELKDGRGTVVRTKERATLAEAVEDFDNAVMEKFQVVFKRLFSKQNKDDLNKPDNLQETDTPPVDL